MNLKSVFSLTLFSTLIFFALSYQSYSEAASFSAVSDSAKNELNGQIESKKGKSIYVIITSVENLPAIGTHGILSKYFEEEILGFSTHGYLDIGEVEVKDVEEGVITFSLIKELSNIKINGKKENHFKNGNVVRFIW